MSLPWGVCQARALGVAIVAAGFGFGCSAGAAGSYYAGSVGEDDYLDPVA